MRLFLPSLALFAACAPARPIESRDVLDRGDVAQSVEVRHILIGWGSLEANYRRQGLSLDPRAQERSASEADALAEKLLLRCRAGEPMEPLMREFSEDPGSAESGVAYALTPRSKMAPGFAELALRLKPGECGLVKTLYGWHVMKRVG